MKVPARALGASSALSAIAILLNLLVPARRLVELPPVTRRELTSPEADLYLPPGGPSPGIVLVLGALREGRRYPLLEQAARTIAGCGFAVMVPELGRLRSLILAQDAVEDLVAATLALGEMEGVRRAPVGLIGFSLGASLGLLAAADPRLRSQVACVAGMGGYFRLTDMVASATTGTLAAPSVFAVAASLIDSVPEPDRAVLVSALAEQPDAPLRAMSAVALDSVGPRGRAVLAVLRNRDPRQVERLMQGLEGAGPMIAGLSPDHVIDRVETRVLVLHDERDAYVPVEQARLMRRAVAGRGNFKFFDIRVLEHTEPRWPGGDLRRLARDYVPGLIGLFRFVHSALNALR